MSVSFLNATSALLTGLLTNIFSGSLLPGIEGVNGSLAGVLRLS